MYEPYPGATAVTAKLYPGFFFPARHGNSLKGILRLEIFENVLQRIP